MNDFIMKKLIAFSSLTVLYPSYERAINKIMHSVSVTSTRREPSSAMLLGAAGTGKSTICRNLVNTLGVPVDVEDSHGVYRYTPALLCSIPASCTIKSLSVEILDQLGATDSYSRNAILEHLIITKLKTCKTKVIILDEFHHLLEKGADKTRETLCNWVKSLMNNTLLPFVLVGTPNCEAIIDDHSQLARRYPFRARLNNLGYNSEFKIFLATLIGEMVKIGEFSAEPFLLDEQTKKIFYVISGGNLNTLCLLLSEILLVALLREENTLTREDCISAFDNLDIIPFFSLQGNPFTVDSSTINNILSGHSP